MELTRRDAVLALAAAGVAAGGGAALQSGWEHEEGPVEEREEGPVEEREEGPVEEREEGPVEERDVATLVAAAEVLYPDAVEGVGEFVERYVRRRAADRPDHAEGMAAAAAYLDEYAAAWHDASFAGADPATRDELLRAMGADTADPAPDGSDVERVRYYVVDELLFALYATPTGGELVGIENPQGYPGGTASYRRGPDP